MPCVLFVVGNCSCSSMVLEACRRWRSSRNSTPELNAGANADESEDARAPSEDSLTPGAVEMTSHNPMQQESPAEDSSVSGSPSAPRPTEEATPPYFLAMVTKPVERPPAPEDK